MSTIAVKELNGMIQSSLKMDMSVSSARGRMQLHFLEYRLLLKINGLKCGTKNSPRAALKHTVSAI